MENSIISFDLPYKVKMIEKNDKKPMINFSIVLLVKNDEHKIIKFLNYLENFKNSGGEVCILDIGSTDNSINIARDWGCIIEDGTSFTRVIDEEMSNFINEKFDFDKKENGIVKQGDTYFDYSGARNFLASIASNDMILMLDININHLNIDIENIEKYINDGYDRIIFNKKSISELYNKNKFNWYNIVYEELLENQNNIRIIKAPEAIIRIIDNEQQYYQDKLASFSVDLYINSGNEKITQLFAIELFNNDFLNSAYQQFNLHLNLCKSVVKKCISLVYIGDYFMRNNRDAEGLEYYNKAYLECDTLRLPLYKLGKYYYFKQERKKTIFYLEGCLNIPNNDNDIDDFMYRDGPYSMLYVAYWWIGNIKQGKYYFDKAIEINPYNQLYIDEAIYHYKYKSNNIRGYLSFQDLQYLYENSKKSESVLEIYPDDCRGTHALLNGCDGIVTVILKDKDKNVEFLEKLGNPGNLRILNMTSKESVNIFENENEKFDMIFVNRKYDEIINDYNKYWGISIWEKFSKTMICGYDYNGFKKIIDESFEISGTKDKMWYKNISQFEKTIIYKRK